VFIIEFILFVPAVLFSFFVPGFLLINFLKLQFKGTEKIFFSLISGICLFILSTYLLSYLDIPKAYLIILALLNIFFWIKYFKQLKNFRRFLKPIRELDLISWFVILGGTLAFSYIMFFSGWNTADGIQFLGVNVKDGVRHLSYIQNEINNFPPQHPGIAGLPLKGFHYFYDFLLAKFIQFFGFSVENIYFRFFPPLLALLYGTSFYVISQRLKVNLISQRLILFFAYFSQSLSFIPFILKQTDSITLAASVHPLGLIVNPFTVLPMAMLFGALAVLADIKKSFKYAIFLGLIFGVLSEIKVYAGIIGIFAVSSYSLYLILRHRKEYFMHIIVLLTTTAFITAITFLPNNLKQGGLVWAPLLFYWEMMKNPVFDFTNWVVKYQISYEAKDTLKIWFLLLQAAIIYWIYNLGLLSVIFLKLKRLFSKEFWLSNLHFILFTATFISVLIPSFFIQSFNVFEIQQFFWFTFALLSIPGGIALGQFLKNKYFKFIVIGLIILFSLPGLLDTLSIYSPFGNRVIATNHELSFYKKIEANVSEKSFIVYIPVQFMDKKEELYFYEFFGQTAFYSYLTNRDIYLEGGGLPSKSSRSVEKQRANKLMQLDKVIADCNIEETSSNLRDIGSKYLLTQRNYPCLATGSAVLKTFSSGTYQFYVFK